MSNQYQKLDVNDDADIPKGAGLLEPHAPDGSDVDEFQASAMDKTPDRSQTPEQNNRQKLLGGPEEE